MQIIFDVQLGHGCITEGMEPHEVPSDCVRGQLRCIFHGGFLSTNMLNPMAVVSVPTMGALLACLLPERRRWTESQWRQQDEVCAHLPIPGAHIKCGSATSLFRGSEEP